MLGLENYISYDSGPGLIAAGLTKGLQLAAAANFLHLVTDQLPLGAGGGILPIDADVLQEMTREEGWNDKPMIDRVLTALIATGKKKQKPTVTITRLLVIVPTKSEVHMVIAFGFTPINPDDAADVRKSGQWTLSYSFRGGAPVNGQGDFIRGREDLSHMLGEICAVFAALRAEFGLTAPPQREEPQQRWDLPHPTGG